MIIEYWSLLYHWIIDADLSEMPKYIILYQLSYIYQCACSKHVIFMSSILLLFIYLLSIHLFLILQCREGSSRHSAAYHGQPQQSLHTNMEHKNITCSLSNHKIIQKIYKPVIIRDIYHTWYHNEMQNIFVCKHNFCENRLFYVLAVKQPHIIMFIEYTIDQLVLHRCKTYVLIKSHLKERNFNGYKPCFFLSFSMYNAYS